MELFSLSFPPSLLDLHRMRHILLAVVVQSELMKALNVRVPEGVATAEDGLTMHAAVPVELSVYIDPALPWRKRKEKKKKNKETKKKKAKPSVNDLQEITSSQYPSFLIFCFFFIPPPPSSSSFLPSSSSSAKIYASLPTHTPWLPFHTSSHRSRQLSGPSLVASAPPL